MQARIFEFGEFKLDCGRFELSRNGYSLRLERKPLELLILLAESNGQLVSRTEIAKRLWDSEVFVDTEHGINTAIRKIRMALRDDSEEPHFIQTVTGMGYRFIAPVTETGVISNEDEETESSANAADSGIPAETVTFKPVSSPANPSAEEAASSYSGSGPRRGVIWIAVAGAVVAAALLAFAAPGPRSFVSRLLHRSAKPAITSLAVLPLDNLSGDPGQDYFADGMTDELTTMLAKSSTLRITSRTSAMQYKGVHRPLRDIAKELGVDGILEGSIARNGDNVHMTIQLIQAPTDTHLWAESYDRNANDVVDLPREAAQAIAKRAGSLTPQTLTARYVNPAAHDAYLHGRYLWFSSEYEKAFVYFKKATEIQPDYAAGWSGLAVAYGASAVEGMLRPADSLAQSEDAATKAVQLDDSSPEAHHALCGALFLYRWDWVRADQECKRAIELDPRFAEAYHFRSMMLASLNRHAESIEAEKKAAEISPFERPYALALSYNLARQYDAALSEARARVEASPSDPALHWVLSETYRRKGMGKEAAEEIAKELSSKGLNEAANTVRAHYRKGGYEAVVRGEIADREHMPVGEYEAPADLALYYAQLKDREKTLTLLEKAYRERSPLLLWMQCEPAFDFLHSEERYRTIVNKIGLPPAY